MKRFYRLLAILGTLSTIILSPIIAAPRIGSAERFRVPPEHRARIVWDLYVNALLQNEPTYLVTDRGTLAVFHSYEDGTFDRTPYEDLKKVGYVVTCYPRRVRERFPDLNVIGNWEGYTGVSFDPFTGLLAIRPRSFSW